jgi:hypothetical protein
MQTDVPREPILLRQTKWIRTVNQAANRVDLFRRECIPFSVNYFQLIYAKETLKIIP